MCVECCSNTELNARPPAPNTHSMPNNHPMLSEPTSHGTIGVRLHSTTASLDCSAVNTDDAPACTDPPMLRLEVAVINFHHNKVCSLIYLSVMLSHDARFRC